MTESLKLPILIYDGDCAFCSSTVRLLQRLMPKHPAMEPFQFVATEKYGLTKQQCAEEIKYVDDQRSVFGGEAAFRKFFYEAGGAWRLLSRLMMIPGVLQISSHVYRWVAKNRHRLPGGTPTCSLPRKYETEGGATN